jgi:hypothetical protein
MVIGLTAQHHHVSLNSLIALRTGDTDSARFEVIARIGTLDPRVFVDELRRAGIVVSSANER